MKMNFDKFQIQKMNITNRAQKVDEKMVLFDKFPFFLPQLWSLNYPQKCIFCKFVLTSARNLNLLKQFISIHLKDLIMLFQKIIFFIGIRAIVHEIFKNKI